MYPGTQTLDAKILLKIPHGSIDSNKEPLGMRLSNSIFPGLCSPLWGGGGWWESEGNFKGPGNEIGFQTNFFLILYVLIQCIRRMWTHFHFWRPKLKLDPARNTNNLFIFEHIHIRGNLGNKPRDCLWSTKTGKNLFQ